MYMYQEIKKIALVKTNQSQIQQTIPVVDVDGEVEGTEKVGDRVHGGVPQDRGDAVAGVCGLTPSAYLHVEMVPCRIPL